MIRHIVFFKFKDKSPEVIQKTKDLLLGLKDKIPELVDIEAGADIIRSERSFDLALVSTFRSLADLDAYQVHPAHQEVAKYIGTVRESAASVDFEVE